MSFKITEIDLVKNTKEELIKNIIEGIESLTSSDYEKNLYNIYYYIVNKISILVKFKDFCYKDYNTIVNNLIDKNIYINDEYYHNNIITLYYRDFSLVFNLIENKFTIELS